MKVSIIVPVYKSEPFLEDCINSIINQIFPNLEKLAPELLKCTGQTVQMVAVSGTDFS